MTKPIACKLCPSGYDQRDHIDLAPGEAFVTVDRENDIGFGYNALRRKWHRFGFKGSFGHGYIEASVAAKEHPDLIRNFENCEGSEVVEGTDGSRAIICPAIAQALGSMTAQNVMNYFNVNK